MTDVARIESGLVVQVWRETSLAGLPQPHDGLVEFASGEAVCGMAWDGETLSVPVPVPTKDDLLAYLAAKRFAVETGGIVIPGDPPLPCWTDRATQSFLARIVESLDRAFVTAPLKIKTPAGAIAMTQEQIETIAALVAQHVQACFDLEADLADEIEAETMTTTAEIDAAAWPSSEITT